jgi:hypothetical protein
LGGRSCQQPARKGCGHDQQGGPASRRVKHSSNLPNQGNPLENDEKRPSFLKKRSKKLLNLASDVVV